MTFQGELFSGPGPAPPVPGFVLVRDAVSREDEATLIERIDAAPLEPFKFGQWRGKRVTTHYGSAYDFSRSRLDEAPPMPMWLTVLRGSVAPLAGLEPDALQAALLIRYDPGAGIGWHRDRPQYGDVLGLSLGAECTMRLRRRTGTGIERRNVPLPVRSLYRLSDEARWDWEHSIVPMARTRWSITYRSLRRG